MLDSLIARYRAGDRRALARLLTLVARGEQLEAIRAAVGPRSAQANVVAITGNSGVGKSTLVGRLAELARQHGVRVAVLACDPQSPLTGGALLGDRLRMASRPDDPDLYIRSVAAAGGHQALAEHVDLMVRLLAEFGFQLILLETVGAGQGDTAVSQLADAVVLLVQPESGDAVQWEKAGLSEVADVIVVHKADLPGADVLEAELMDQIVPGAGHAARIVRVSSAKQQGLAELWELISNWQRRPLQNDLAASQLLQRAQQLLAERFRQQPGATKAVLGRLAKQEVDLDQAAAELARELLR